MYMHIFLFTKNDYGLFANVHMYMYMHLGSNQIDVHVHVQCMLKRNVVIIFHVIIITLTEVTIIMQYTVKCVCIASGYSYCLFTSYSSH